MPIYFRLFASCKRTCLPFYLSGFTGVPYPTSGMDLIATAPPMAPAVSEPVVFSSTYTGIHEPMPRRYAEDYHRPPTGVGPTFISGYGAPETGYAMPAPGFTSPIGPRSIRTKVEPLYPLQGSLTPRGASPHRVHANQLVAGLTHTLCGVRSRPMPTTPKAIPKRPFVPRTAQPPYSHGENSTRAELDQFGLTALRALIDVEPYGSSDVRGDPFDDEPPSLASGSPSESDDPEDPENPSDKKKKRKRKSRRHERRRSKEAKAISTSKIVVNLPELTGRDLSKFAESFGQFLRMTSQTQATGRVKCDLLLQCCKTNYPGEQVKRSGDEVHYLRRHFGRLGEAAPFL